MNSMNINQGINSNKFRKCEIWAMFLSAGLLLSWAEHMRKTDCTASLSFCDQSRNFTWVNPKFWRYCKKFSRKLNLWIIPGQFPRKFLTNCSKLRNYSCKIPGVVKLNFDSGNQTYKNTVLWNLAERSHPCHIYILRFS